MEHNNELVSLVIEKVKAGEGKAKIEDSLLKEGYLLEDIDRAISHIKKAALREIPVLSSFLSYMDHLETAAADLSVGKQIMIMIGVALFVLFVGVGLYIRFDPLNIRANDSVPVSSETSPLLPEEVVATTSPEQPTQTPSSEKLNEVSP